MITPSTPTVFSPNGQLIHLLSTKFGVRMAVMNDNFLAGFQFVTDALRFRALDVGFTRFDFIGASIRHIHEASPVRLSRFVGDCRNTDETVRDNKSGSFESGLSMGIRYWRKRIRAHLARPGGRPLYDRIKAANTLDFRYV